MTGPEDGAERSHEPSERRLQQARADGDIPRSADLPAAAALAGLLICLVFWGGALVERSAMAGSVILAQPDLLSTGAAASGAALRMIVATLPVFLVPAAMALLALVATRAIVFSPPKLLPDLGRLSLLRSLRQKFGLEGLVAFGRSLVKLILVGAAVTWWSVRQLDEIVGAVHLAPAAVAARMAQAIVEVAIVAVAIFGALSLLDVGWQWLAFLRRNRMTRQELVEDQRESEGDPHLKAARRGRGEAIAMNRMMQDVPRADVVIVNPTHFAVALRWERTSGRAPRVVAKGVDEVAARIRAAAVAAGVPLHRDPPTARQLHAVLQIGQEIHPDHYKAVAAAIRFAEAMRRRARRRASPGVSAK